MQFVILWDFRYFHLAKFSYLVQVSASWNVPAALVPIAIAARRFTRIRRFPAFYRPTLIATALGIGPRGLFPP